MTDVGNQPSVWDSKTQTYHGGQDWSHLSNFVCDFSVTTNALGTPKKALEAAIKSLQTIEHYPSADFEPALSSLAKWLFNFTENSTPVSASGNPLQFQDIKKRFTLGNGASELIDLITRQAPRGAWKPGPSMVGSNPVQYREYQRSAQADQRNVLTEKDGSEAISAIINPCNPTGVYLSLSSLQKYISTESSPNSFVLVDESMLPWIGPNWRDCSLLSDVEWIDNILKEKGIAVWVIYSWTKIWSCPGIRLGSVFAPSATHMEILKRKQVPWSLNTAAIAFTAEVVKDDLFMKKTWEVTREWRDLTISQLSKLFPSWIIYGEPWLSWLWIDCKSEEVVKKVIETAKKGGVPIRSGVEGYNCPTFIRLAVREPQAQSHLFTVLKLLAE